MLCFQGLVGESISGLDSTYTETRLFLGAISHENMRSLWDSVKHTPLKSTLSFVIVIPSYNNAEWYKRNLDSVFAQSYKNFTVIYLDDCSPDGTGKLVKQYVQEKNMQHVVTVIENSERVGALANIYRAGQACSDEKIIITLDGDDLLAHENVLALLNIVYQDPKVWITYGCDIRWPSFERTSCTELPAHVPESGNFRLHPFSTGPTRTFYAWLFKKVQQEDLTYNGTFFDVCSDQAIMFPMLEMAGNRIKFIPDVTYIYNVAGLIHDFKLKADLQKNMCDVIVARRPYQRLNDQRLNDDDMSKQSITGTGFIDTRTDCTIKNSIKQEKIIPEIVDYVPKQMREIIVVIPSYNNKSYFEGNLDSLVMQKYENWRAVYINDQSSDGTGESVKNYIKQHNLEHKITLIQNLERRGALANLYTTIHACPDEAVIVMLDGDDTFAHENVLSQVNKVYDYFDVWMTYGSYVDSSNYTTSCCADYPQEVVQTNSFRKYPWIASSLRTCYAGLFKCIKKEDLMKDGIFLPVAWDLAIMFPMLEMAGERFKFIPEVLYIYNNENPIADYRKSEKLQNELDDYIRKLAPYKRITTRALSKKM